MIYERDVVFDPNSRVGPEKTDFHFALVRCVGNKN